MPRRSAGPPGPPIVLASVSPRRRALLQAGCGDFEAREPSVNEHLLRRGDPRAVVLKTALAKATDVGSTLSQGTIVIAADTMVVVDDGVFNKPRDRAEARRMLRRLSGREHEVITGLAVLRVGGESVLDADQATVRFHALDAPAIAAYVDSGEADDKAGAYGIQGRGAEFVAVVEGDLTCVIGLPLGRLCELFKEMTGADLLAGVSPRRAALDAFEELMRLPAACLDGIPD